MTSFQNQYIAQVKELADKMRRETMPPLTEELFALFETTGNRLEYEAVYFKRRKFLAVFGVAVYLFRQPADIAKLEEVLQQICEEECWALPAHVNRRDNADWRHTVDLFAVETAQSLAEIVVLLSRKEDGLTERKVCQGKLVGDETVLTKSTVETVCSEIEKRVFLPFENSRQNWECSDHNWNAVCCGGIGSAAIYLLAGREEDRLEKMLQRICDSLQFYLDGFREDGTCMEGIGYFIYGMTYFTGFAEQLLHYSNSKINLFASDKVRKIAEFQQKVYFSNGQTVSFSDGEANAKFRLGLTCLLAEQFDTVNVPDTAFACDFESDSCYRFMGLLRDYLWSGNGKRMVCLFRHDVLPDAQWSICESRNGVGFAIKGGDNGEPHNHNDVGSFLYQTGGEQLLCDLGAGEYTADYFGTGRYEILCNSSKGHNVPVINGKFQKVGKQYHASRFEADGRGLTKLEFAGAYGMEELKILERTAKFSMENGSLMMTDYVVMENPPEIMFRMPFFTETLVTKGKVRLLKQEIQIQGEKAGCRILLTDEMENLRISEQIHADHEGKSERIFLIQWDVPLKKTGAQISDVYCGSSKYHIKSV